MTTENHAHNHATESPKVEAPPQTQERPRTQAPPVAQERIIVPHKPTLLGRLWDPVQLGHLVLTLCLLVFLGHFAYNYWRNEKHILELQEVRTELTQLRADTNKATTTFLEHTQKLVTSLQDQEKKSEGNNSALQTEIKLAKEATANFSTQVNSAQQKLDDILSLKKVFENAQTYSQDTLKAVAEIEAKILALQTGVAGLQPSRQGLPVVSKEKEKDKTTVPPPVGNPRSPEVLVKEGQNLLEKTKTLEGDAKNKALQEVADKATEAIAANADYAPAYLLRAQARLALGDRLWRVDNDMAKKLIDKK